MQVGREFGQDGKMNYGQSIRMPRFLKKTTSYALCSEARILISVNFVLSELRSSLQILLGKTNYLQMNTLNSF